MDASNHLDILCPLCQAMASREDCDNEGENRFVAWVCRTGHKIEWEWTEYENDHSQLDGCYVAFPTDNDGEYWNIHDVERHWQPDGFSAELPEKALPQVGRE